MANLPYKVIRILNEVRRTADQSITDMDKKIEHLTTKYDQVVQENAKLKKEIQETLKSIQTLNQTPTPKEENAGNAVMETRSRNRKRTGSVPVVRCRTRESRSKSRLRAKGTKRRTRSAHSLKMKRRKVAKKGKRGKSRRR